LIDKRRAGRYERIYTQLCDLIEGKSPNLLAAMATTCAVLHHKMSHHFWTGFYFVVDENELHVGPYQGAVACQVLRGRGVCLHCVHTGQPVIVPDVEQFPGQAGPIRRGRRRATDQDIEPVTAVSHNKWGKETESTLSEGDVALLPQSTYTINARISSLAIGSTVNDSTVPSFIFASTGTTDSFLPSE